MEVDNKTHPNTDALCQDRDTQPGHGPTSGASTFHTELKKNTKKINLTGKHVPIVDEALSKQMRVWSSDILSPRD